MQGNATNQRGIKRYTPPIATHSVNNNIININIDHNICNNTDDNIDNYIENNIYNHIATTQDLTKKLTESNDKLGHAEQKGKELAEEHAKCRKLALAGSQRGKLIVAVYVCSETAG